MSLSPSKLDTPVGRVEHRKPKAELASIDSGREKIQ